MEKAKEGARHDVKQDRTDGRSLDGRYSGLCQKLRRFKTHILSPRSESNKTRFLLIQPGVYSAAITALRTVYLRSFWNS